MAIATKITPLNLDSEKKKFLFDPNYNPQFAYLETPTEEELGRYGTVSNEYMKEAESILDTVIKKFGSETEFLDKAEGTALTRAEVESLITTYLQENNLEKKVTVSYSGQYIPRTHVDGYKLNIRLPIDYRDKSFIGVLHHEIGTHVFRRMNDEFQPWNKNRTQFNLIPYLETEEGMATLHSHIGMEEPYMWIKALLYVAVYWGSTMTFSQLFSKLKKYVPDQDRRWKICIRVKRGVSDTSQPAVFTKDQIYLRGVIKIAKWLQHNDYQVDRLYVGKVAMEDLKRVSAMVPTYVPIVPHFLKDMSQYKHEIESILRKNNLLTV